MGDAQIGRRSFMKKTGLSAAALAVSAASASAAKRNRRPNLVFVFGDQWRAQATGYAGDPNAKTPNLDALAGESINLTNTVSGCPVCSPYRGSLLTGQFPLTHGVFMNDLHLNDDATSIADVYSKEGYDTAYIGKWHLDGRGRSSFIPKRSRQGFDFWKVLECTHRYNKSAYYADKDDKLAWKGYDAIAQTKEAREYIRRHADDKPFVLFLSWGPPHAPYHTAPSKYAARFHAKNMKLRENVPANWKKKAARYLAGYYAHIAALDDCIGKLARTLRETGIEDNTIFVFTSDHGDMLGSRGQMKKQRPFDESVRVPFLLRYPALLGNNGKVVDMPFSTPDIMPTLLGLSGLSIPNTVQGQDYSGVLKGDRDPDNEAALIACPQPFGQWTRRQGGREYRGVRTRRYTYVRSLEGPWLLYDNKKDPYQLKNLVNSPDHADLLKKLEQLLQAKLDKANDKFLSGPEYIRKWGYKVNKSGTVPYTN